VDPETSTPSGRTDPRSAQTKVGPNGCGVRERRRKQVALNELKPVFRSQALRRERWPGLRQVLLHGEHLSST
jgi:hypothetical protein